MQQWGQIQVLAEQGMADAAIARRLGIDRETVAKWRAQAPPMGIQRSRVSKLDEFRPYLAQRLEEFPELSARVLWRELASLGYDGGYERVKIACRQLRGEPRVEGVARFESGPAEQAQADWLESRNVVEHEGRRRRLNGFIYVLGYSRWSFVEFTVSESQAVLFACFERAFREAGGVPAAIVIDNMKAAVLEHRADEIVFHPAFLAFADHWGFQPIAAPLGRGQTKGKVEAGVKYVKRNCLAGRRPGTLEEAQQHGRWWLREVCNVRVHETTHQRPVDRLGQEREQLRPLPDHEFVYRPQLSRRVYLDFTVRWKDNFYEVPFQHAGKRVLCQEIGDQLSVLLSGQEIARHDLLPGVGRTAQLPDHKEGLYRPSYPSHLPYQRDAFLRVFPDHERFLDECVKRLRGNAAYHLHKVRELVDQWGRDNVSLAIEQATVLGGFNIRAVRRACRRAAALPPPVPAAPPPRRQLFLPQVEQRSLKVYADHVE
jgi:transposase